MYLVDYQQTIFSIGLGGLRFSSYLYEVKKKGISHIKKKLYMRNLNQFNEGYKKHNNSERTVYLTFAASKLSNAVKPNTIVEFTDFRGKTHKVAVRNNTEMRKAMAFFSILKRESVKINQILADYPVRFGKIEKKFIPQVKRELKSIGLTKKAIDVVLG